MKLVVRLLAALSLLALAAPALACGDMKQTTTAAAQPKATKQPVAKAEKKADKKAQAKDAKQQAAGQGAQN
ncbi:MAG TPA: hypothetical protein VM753_02395 [Anaeromyxobacter sp.]|nr:hypothetical protein [Anaeromyxobacter sp.]